jgi:hypothetical protein
MEVSEISEKTFEFDVCNAPEIGKGSFWTAASLPV